MAPTKRTVTTYDFRRPNKLNREHVRALQIVGETFARQFTTVMSTSLRVICQVNLEDVTQQTYDEYVRDLPNPALLTVLELDPLDGFAMLDLPLEIGMTVIDRLLGGNGSGRLPQRSPTEIEGRLLRGVIERLLRELAYAFNSLTPIRPSIVRTETNAQFAQIASTTDMITVITFAIRVGDQRGVTSLAMPFASLQRVLEDATDPARSDRDRGAGEIRRALEETLQHAALDVRVRFDEVAFPSKYLADLAPGDVLPLSHAVDHPLTVEVAGLPRFRATAGTRGKRVACLLTDTTLEVR